MEPTLTLNDQSTIPQLGFGTLNVPPDRTPSPENTAKTAEIVALAIEIGYRHIDTAQMYGNERGVGAGLTTSGVPRDELYITTKLGNGNHRPDDVHRSFEESLTRLGLDHLDLFLIHWPLPTLYDGDFVSTWKAMVALVGDGRLRSVGVSNFQPEHLDRIVAETGIAPAVNQIEVHPGFANGLAVDASLRHGVAVEGWSPLGQGKALDSDTVNRIARDHDATAAQVALRWQLQRGHVVIPKTMRRERMVENLGALDLELTPDEMAAIDSLDAGQAGRIGPNPETFDWIPTTTNGD
jgi:2,5-diketo-D-gluconate reductase A